MLSHSFVTESINADLSVAGLNELIANYDNFVTDLGQRPQDGKFFIGCPVYRGTDFRPNEIAEHFTFNPG